MITVKQDDSVATNHIGIVTPATLIQLNVLNHAWVSISCELAISNSNQTGVSVAKCFQAFEQKKKDYVVQLTVHDDYDYMKLIDIDDVYTNEDSEPSLSNGIVYVSSSAFFNIMNRNVERYVKYRTKEIKANINFLDEFDSLNKGDYATFVDLSLISCPFGSIELESIDDILKNFFRKPQVLCVNEVFNISLDQVGLHTPLYLWFSVKTCYQSDEKARNCHTNSLFVSAESSKLILSNPVNAHVPQCPCTYKNNKGLLKLFWNDNYREVFLKSKSQIHNAMNILNHKLMPSKDTTILLEGNRGVGKGLMIQSICEEYCIHFHEVNCFDLIGESLTATEKRIENLFELFLSVGPCVLYLKNVELLCKDKEGSHEERRTLQSFNKQISKLSNDFLLLVIGSTSSVKEMTPRFHSEFVYHVKLDCPDESDRASLIKAIADGFFIDDKIITDLVKKTSGFVLADFIALFTKIRNINGKNVDVTSNNFMRNLYRVDQEAADAAFEELRMMKAGSSNVVRIPKVKWDDVGGLHHVKKEILDTIELPLKFPNLFSSSLQRSGLLFYGPPGCGKTLLAKAIATEFTLNFYSVKGPELINMYVGQSEENVRNVFVKARSMAPCIIFFDELDSIAPNRGRSGDSGGVMDRIVSQLLSELDGIHNNLDIFIIGATNRPDLLEPALLRPGRFDRVIYVGIAEDRDERLRILKAVTRKLNFSKDIDLNLLIDMCPLNLTGADFSALASECLMNCYRRLISQHEDHNVELNSEDVLVTIGDLQLAFSTLVPSVSVSELQRYNSIRKQFMRK